jgi:hypothetical protein
MSKEKEYVEKAINSAIDFIERLKNELGGNETATDVKIDKKKYKDNFSKFSQNFFKRNSDNEFIFIGFDEWNKTHFLKLLSLYVNENYDCNFESNEFDKIFDINFEFKIWSSTIEMNFICPILNEILYIEIFPCPSEYKYKIEFELDINHKITELQHKIHKYKMFREEIYNIPYNN